MSSEERKLILVKNNNDDGDGSLRDAIRQGNEFVEAGHAIEIGFSKGLHIKPLKGYQLKKGDWIFNKTKRMNIIIDGKNTEGSLFTIGSPENTLASKTVGDIPELRVDAHRIHLINSHVKGGNGKNGGGGGLGAGAVLLHWNGHVTWSNSSFQGNKVEGGIGAESPKGDGNGTYRNGWSPVGGPNNGGKVSVTDSRPGRSGGTGGGFNQDNKISRDPANNGKGGVNAKLGNSDIRGRDGNRGGNGINIGEGGDGGGNGGGGTWRKGTIDKYYGHSNGGRWLGRGGKGGDGGNAAFGGGGGAPGLPGGRAGTAEFSVINYSAGGSRSFNKDWQRNETHAVAGQPGRGGAWGSAATEAGSPTWKSGKSTNSWGKSWYTFIPAAPGRGGDGAALGIVSSLAHKNQQSSIKLIDIDFRKNNASGGEKVGKFTNIYSRHIPVHHNYVTHSTTDSNRGNVLSGTQLNTSADTTDKSKTYQYSGTFQQDTTATQNLSDNKIYSISHQTDLTTVQSFGNTYQLGKPGGHIIALSAEQKDQDIQQLQIEGSEQLIQAVTRINQAANRTQTEQAIRATHKGLFGSVSNSKVVGAATSAAGEAVSEAVDQFASKIGESTAGKIGAYAGLGALGLIFETLIFQEQEDARIEKELKKKAEIDREREEIKTLIPQELKVSKFSLTQTRTYDVFNNFKIGRDQIVLGSFIRPELDVNTLDGVTRISINATRDENNDDNKPRKIGEIRLTSDQTKEAIKHRNEKEYFAKLLQPTKTNGTLHYVFSKETEFQEFSRNSDSQPGGIANDRIIIKRNSEIANNIKLEVNGYEGDDKIIGDNGFSILKGEVGSDFFDPKEGNDTIDGGTDIDTVSYLSITKPVTVAAKSDGNISVTNSELTDTIEDVEVLRTWAGSTHDLSEAKESTLETEGGGYNILTGSNSNIIGSNYNDIFTISYSSSFNDNPGSIFNKPDTQNPSQVDSLKSTIKGGAGTNILALDALGAHINQGIEFKFQYNRDKKKGKLIQISKNQELEVIDFEGIDNVIFTDAENTSNGTLKAKAASDAPSIAVSADWDISTDGSDPVFGGSNAEQIESGDADDLVKAGSGDDEVIGGKGDDVIFGEEGNDAINGGQGNDILSGGNDTDVINGQEGDDQLDGGADDDSIFGENGNDLLIGGDGNDTLSGGIGSDSIYGGDGNNIFLPEKDNSVDKIIITTDGITDAIYSLDFFDEIIIQGTTSNDLDYAIVDGGIGIFAGGVLEAIYFNSGTNLTAADLSNMTRAETI